MNGTWQLQPILGSYLVPIVVTMVLLLPLMVPPRFAQMTPARRRWLLGLRVALALLLLIGMLRPAWITTKRKEQRAHVAILYDVSRSMQIADGQSGETRWSVQQTLLHRILPILNRMQDHFEVSLRGFAADLITDSASKDPLALIDQAEGEETDLGQALSRVMEQHVGDRLAAVILISDGSQRSAKSELPPQQAARQLDRRATPLYTVAIGRSQDQSQSRDVAIENMADEFSVFVKNELELHVGIRIQGYVNQAIPVSLNVVGADGQTETLGPVSVVATQDSQVVMADFVYRPEIAGQYRLEVAASLQTGEMVADNNRQTSFLEVRDGGLRVLYLTSALLHPEKKFIRLSLAASTDINLDFVPVDLLTQDRWPIDLQGEIPLREYDVFLIGDLDANALRPDNWQLIAGMVEDGRGLMMLGGFHSFGPGGYAETPLSSVLPIDMDRLEYQGLDPQAEVRSDAHLSGPLTMIPVGEHPITHLGGSQNGVWKTLRPLLGANRFRSVKDRSRVLAETSTGEPLLVQGTFVEGRVLAFAADSTYLWWRHGNIEAHKRFWRQSILWLARRDGLQANQVWIKLPQRRFRKGSRVDFETGYADPQGKPVADAKLVARVTLPDRLTQTVELSQLPEGQRGSWLDTSQPGVYRVDVELDPASHPESTDSAQSAEWVVMSSDLELSDPVANPGLMDLLAKTTQRVGGRSVPAEQLPAVLEEIEANPARDEIETESKWQLADTALDAWAYFLTLLGCLVTEWVLRKKWGMV